ncbi:UNVERIFIED_CONTAM: hypothetical protein Slati_1318000 [Sesamum latifolium]|uniref:Uncharacterized protein n=1 Tax=Sesamum latifolium TaxID=2727402 RepID=A0AAW2XHN9_9LAMI
MESSVEHSYGDDANISDSKSESDTTEEELKKRKEEEEEEEEHEDECYSDLQQMYSDFESEAETMR